MGNYKSIDGPDTYFMFHGKLRKVVGIANGKTIHSVPVPEEICKCCGQVIDSRSDLESSPNFQNGAEPVKTLKT